MFWSRSHYAASCTGKERAVYHIVVLNLTDLRVRSQNLYRARQTAFYYFLKLQLSKACHATTRYFSSQH